MMINGIKGSHYQSHSAWSQYNILHFREPDLHCLLLFILPSGQASSKPWAAKVNNISIWRNSCKTPNEAPNNHCDALRLSFAGLRTICTVQCARLSCSGSNSESPMNVTYTVIPSNRKSISLCHILLDVMRRKGTRLLHVMQKPTKDKFALQWRDLCFYQDKIPFLSRNAVLSISHY